MGEPRADEGSGRQVFDAKTLEEAAAALREDKSKDLVGMLRNALTPPGAWGSIEGASEAAGRLQSMLLSLNKELGKVGIDLADLASRTLAASELARGVNPATVTAANKGAVPQPGGPK